MRHIPFMGTILELSYAEIPLFLDLGIFEKDGPMVCRMDVADLEEVMAEVAFWVYNDIGNIYCTWPSLGHTWGVDKCADLWQVCYQYCTDVYMYQLHTYLDPTERFEQLYADWKKDFNVKPGDKCYDPYPGGDEWVLSYLQSHSS
ncbi:MAG: hypothetical protein Q4P66_04840, partial [Actinomycetaceae bacterium]|nr:hypothetical protein [Actinomycetaceae bacterium]